MDAQTAANVVTWAKNIAKDNSWHYNTWNDDKRSHVCPICNNTPKGRYHGWNCIGFAWASWKHGGGLANKCNNSVIDNGTAEKILKASDAKALEIVQKKSGLTDVQVIRNGGDYVAKKNLQAGDICLYFNGNTYIHTFLYIGDGKMVDSQGSSGNIPINDQIKVRDVYKTKVAIRFVGTGGGGAATGTDSGQGLDMKQNISKLWSSSNYQRIYDDEKYKKSAELESVFKDKIKNALNNIKFDTISPDSSAIPEIILSNEINQLNFERDKPEKLSRVHGVQLTSFPTIVEAPTIVLDFNGYKIGGYGNRGDKYPNYISNMQVQKINGKINKYTINLVYQVRPGEDPNFIDKLLSKTGYTNPLKILYGDSNYPSSYFREEEALIMDVKHTENVKAYTMNYTISAISSIGASITSYKTFSSRIAKPSTVIYDLLYNSGEISDSLLKLFPGMKNKALVSSNGLIPTNDSTLLIGGMENVNPIDYLSYLVSCMKNDNDSSTYYLSYVDNAISKFGGTYFKISEVKSYNNKSVVETPIASTVFELDIGYPSNNFVTNFQLCTDNYWPLVYKYAGDIPKWDYGIDNDGNVIENKTNILFENKSYSEESVINSNWWRQVTEFPIAAKVTLKGLISPAMLMSYIKINTLFYGRRDIASGLYVVTKQEDTVSGSGYTTELTLLRVAGD